MNVLKWFLDQIDFAFAIWSILIIPVVALMLIQFVPIPTLGLIGLAVHYQLSSADLMKRSYFFTLDKEYLKLKRRCYSHAIVILLISMACFGFFIYWDIHGGYLCEDYTSWFEGGDYLPGMLPRLLQHVMTASCPAPQSIN